MTAVQNCFSFYHVSPGNQTQVIRLVSSCLQSLNCYNIPKYTFKLNYLIFFLNKGSLQVLGDNWEERGKNIAKKHSIKLLKNRQKHKIQKLSICLSSYFPIVLFCRSALQVISTDFGRDREKSYDTIKPNNTLLLYSWIMAVTPRDYYALFSFYKLVI